MALSEMFINIYFIIKWRACYDLLHLPFLNCYRSVPHNWCLYSSLTRHAGAHGPLQLRPGVPQRRAWFEQARRERRGLVRCRVHRRLGDTVRRWRGSGPARTAVRPTVNILVYYGLLHTLLTMLKEWCINGNWTIVDRVRSTLRSEGRFGFEPTIFGSEVGVPLDHRCSQCSSKAVGRFL